MNWAQKVRGWEIGTLLLLVASAGTILSAARMRLAARTAVIAEAQSRREWKRLVATGAGRPAAVAEVLEEKLERFRRIAADGLVADPALGDARTPGEAPADSVSAFFELTAYRQRMQTAARAAKVALQPGEHFGFASYVNQGPAAACAAAVLRQQIVCERALDCLFAAEPEALLAVRRERNPGELPEEGAHATDSPPLSPTTRSGYGEGAIGLEFTGDTTVLRRFLRSVSRLPQALLARRVTVANVVGANAARISGTQLLVAPAPRHFTVEIVAEEIESRVRVVDIDRRRPDPPARADFHDPESWEAPRPQSAGPAWMYDLFTPPTVFFDPVRGKHWVAGEADTLPVAPQLRLRSVRREPFALQLAGYFGSPETGVVAFTRRGSTETLLARVGQRVGATEYFLDRFAVHETTVDSARRAGESRSYATVLLRSEKSSAEIFLREGRETFTDELVGNVESANGKLLEVRLADAWIEQGTEFTVEFLRADPAEARLGWRNVDGREGVLQLREDATTPANPEVSVSSL